MTHFGFDKSVLNLTRDEGILQGIKDAWKYAALNLIRSDPRILGAEYNSMIDTERMKLYRRECYLITISPKKVKDIADFEEKIIKFVERKAIHETWAYSIEKIDKHIHVHMVIPYFHRSPNEVHKWADSTFSRYVTSDHTVDVRCHDSLEKAFTYITKEVKCKISQKMKNLLVSRGKIPPLSLDPVIESVIQCQEESQCQVEDVEDLILSEEELSNSSSE